MAYLGQEPAQQTQSREIPILLDPNLLKAARRIYRTYCSLHVQLARKPFGVAIDRDSQRGQLIFKEKPILLPGESFIPVRQLETEMY